ncbi:MAG TPA: hypothetical protein PLK99_07770, partial [Burkholderiales bacterium]|nr:hypothetical protein [Burkholderiales bacterium]
ARNMVILASSLEGNVPWRFLIDRQVFHAVIVAVEWFDFKEPIPRHELLFNAIGDADLCGDGLKIAERMARDAGSPVINKPDAVMKTGRMQNSERLGRIPGVIAPKVFMAPKPSPDAGEDPPLPFPLLLRAPGFHGGSHFVRVEDRKALNREAGALPGDSLLFMEFLDCCSEEGLYRKFRVMSIDGRLYPIHLAISGQWKVHYFSSGMARNADFRREEEAFLGDFDSYLGPKAIEALEGISRTLDLDYCGIDFGLDREGNVLLFEANATMSLIPIGPEKEWEYRREPVSAAIEAAGNMFLARL